MKNMNFDLNIYSCTVHVLIKVQCTVHV